eukprot:scaffold33419_cov101-Isochrysis_galbana.AAC.2
MRLARPPPEGWGRQRCEARCRNYRVPVGDRQPSVAPFGAARICSLGRMGRGPRYGDRRFTAVGKGGERASKSVNDASLEGRSEMVCTTE